MIDELKQINRKSMLTIDEDAAKQFTGIEDLTVTDQWHYDYDSVAVVFVEFDTYYLIANNFLGEVRYFLCEEYDTGEEYFDTADQDFLPEIQLISGDDSPLYAQSHAPWHNDDDDDEVAAVCEYAAEHHFDYMIVVWHEGSVVAYRGLEINEDSILL